LTGEVTLTTQPGYKGPWVFGAGGFSTVYKGEWLKSPNGSPQDVAVKIFRTTSNQKEGLAIAIKRLIRESNAWRRLSHKNIQPYYGYCSNLDPSLALISPFCGNGTVMDYIRNTSADDDIRNKFVTDVASCLAYLHSHEVVHGDLKPNNILVDDAGNACLTDFGRAKVLGESGFTTDLCAGAAAYMAPELLPQSDEEKLSRFITPSADIYAFAMLAFEIFTDEVPYRSLKAKTQFQIMLRVHQGIRPLRSSDTQNRISDKMWEIMQNCWVHDPVRRPLATVVVQDMSESR